MSRYIRPVFKSVNLWNRAFSSYRPLGASGFLFRHLESRPPALSFSTSLPQRTEAPPKSTPTPSTPNEAQKQMDPKLRERIESIIKSDTLVLFMKGTPAEPACGFSMRAARILQVHGVPFSAIDIFEEDGIREGLKTYSSWPTFPQLYANGKLVGGADIMLEMHQSGELVEMFSDLGLHSKLLDQPPPSEKK